MVVAASTELHQRKCRLTSAKLLIRSMDSELSWRAAQEKALGLTETTTLPDLPESEIINIRRRSTRGGE